MTVPDQGRPPLAVAAIIAVGSEMLRHDRVDTNSLQVTARLEELGIAVAWKAIVGDHRVDLAEAVRFARTRADLVVITGGLGPTDDDLTRDAVADALGRGMSHDEPTIEAIRARFARRQMAMPAINRRQGLVIDGAALLANTNGTAPGQWIDDDDRVILLLPGPPREMRPMLDAVVAGPLAARTGREQLVRRSVRIAGRSESHAEELLQPLYAAWSQGALPVAATILAAHGLLELQLTVRTADTALAAAVLDGAVAGVVAAFGDDAFSIDGATIEVVVGRLLGERRLRVAIAESCTGGLVSARLTDIAGASSYFERAVVAYSNAAKCDLLGVPAASIETHGAVSEPVAIAMAAGVRARASVDAGVAITGIAGPSGGSDEKPVGTVVIAVSGPGDHERVRTFLFPGGRGNVRTLAAQSALDQLRRALLASA